MMATARLTALIALAAALVAPSCGPREGAPPPGQAWRQRAVEGFIVGANYWHNYGGDFGGNAWGDHGVAASRGRVGRDLAAMAAAGVQAVRWPLFADGRAGIRWGADGTPLGLDDGVLQDVDAAVALAGYNGLCVVFVLFDFHLFFAPEEIDGVVTGGHADAWADPAKRDALVRLVVAPVVERLGGSDTVLGWDIMNEPEWIISDLPRGDPDPRADSISIAAFLDGAARMARAIRAAGPQLVTLGSARARWLPVWEDGWAAARGLPTLGLDLFQAHYYAEMAAPGAFSPLASPAADLGLDRPVLVGEMGLAAGDLEAMEGLGYAGAFGWRWQGDDDATDWREVSRFAKGRANPCA